MASTKVIPVIFLAFSNPKYDLRSLDEEQNAIRRIVYRAQQAGICEFVERPNASVEDIFEVFQDPLYRNRIAIFHYGGHAGDFELLMRGGSAHTQGLDAFLASQDSLHLVFLNGCCTKLQAQSLIEKNIPAVIATSQAIEDTVAADFSFQFYSALTVGEDIESSYRTAENFIKTKVGDFEKEPESHRALIRKSSIIKDKSDKIPWQLYESQGIERQAAWSLAKANKNPLFGLPELPAHQFHLPNQPFISLRYFTEKEAPIFFGRGEVIRDLYLKIANTDNNDLLLFYGQSGAGKSSLLDAGLVPRLRLYHEVCYARRNGAIGLSKTLQTALVGEEKALQQDTSTISSAWKAIEQKSGKPLVVVIDQVEEVFTKPNSFLGTEWRDFLDLLSSIFLLRDQAPKGKLILSYRKEFHAEIERNIEERHLPTTRYFLEHLKRENIVEIVSGLTLGRRTREKYHLEVEPMLPEIIADDLLEDQSSAIAPVLQILLTKMWHQASDINDARPHFTIELYQKLKRGGILLDDFFNQQMNLVREWNAEVEQTGLVLDILNFHTTALGTADVRERKELQQRYSHQQKVLEPLLGKLSELYLLSSVTPTLTGLAHDTLAPLIQNEFKNSDRAGQRAFRILENRVIEFEADPTATLDETDLTLVERGANGMRLWNQKEKLLIEASRQQRKKRKRVIAALRWAGVAVVALIAGFGIWAQYLRGIAEDARESLEITMQQKDSTSKELSKEKSKVEFALSKVKEQEQVLKKNITQLTENEEKLKKAIADATASEQRAIQQGNIARKNERIAIEKGKELEQSLSKEKRAQMAANIALNAANTSTQVSQHHLYFFNAKELASQSLNQQSFDTLQALLALTSADLTEEAFNPQRFSLLGNFFTKQYSPETLEALLRAFSRFGNDLLAKGEVRHLAVNPIYRQVAHLTAEGKIEIADVVEQESDYPYLRKKAQFSLGKNEYLKSLIFNRLGTFLWAASETTLFRLNPQADDKKTKKVEKIATLSAVPLELNLIENEKNALAVLLLEDGKIVLYDLNTSQSQFLEVPAPDKPTAIAVAQPSEQETRLFIGTKRGSLYFYDLGKSKQPELLLKEVSKSPISALAFNKIRNWLVAGTTIGEVFTLTRPYSSNAKQLNPQFFTRHHQGIVSKIAFNATGDWLATASLDQSIMLRNLKNVRANELERLVPVVIQQEGHYVFQVGFATENDYLLTGDAFQMNVYSTDVYWLYEKIKNATQNKLLSSRDWAYFIRGEIQRPKNDD
ncbi:hypothetical protein [Hugenholtzia roseola]|uniref:nSTAND1 domain-containing NTPase n=1 Tax=Hugenholtzia roseola TaxID=1002 RepID=UPI00041D2AE6|nr:hypothetical protein [Hugenholtzia roseola]